MNQFKRSEKTMANLDQYHAVLEDLEKQRNEYLFKVREVEIAISSLRKLMPEEVRAVAAAVEIARPAPLIRSQKFANMSVRWAILYFLSEDATGPISTGAIAEALVAGGITSASKNFAGNVSAILSDMNHNKNEVISTDSGWVISDKGKSAWIHIKATRERSQTPIAFEPPSVQ